MIIAVFLFVFIKRRLDTTTSGVLEYIISRKSGSINPNRDIKSQVSQIGIDPKREISRKSFVVEEEIGSGNFGTVYKGKVNALNRTKSKTTVAVKSITDCVGNDEIKKKNLLVLTHRDYYLLLKNVYTTDLPSFTI